MNLEKITQKTNIFLEEASKLVGMTAIAGTLLIGGIYVSQTQFQKTRTVDNEVLRLRVQAGIGSLGNKYVKLTPSDAEDDSYFLAAIDKNNDGTFQESEFLDWRNRNLPVHLDSTYYYRILEHYTNSRELRKLYDRVAPARAQYKE